MTLEILKIIFSISCVLGLALMGYSRSTKKPRRQKIATRLAFPLMGAWAIFHLVESFLLKESLGINFLTASLCIVDALNVVFYCVGLVLAFFGYFDEENHT